MKKLSYFTLITVSLFAMSFASCSDNDEYKPGETVSEDCPAVYFSGENTNAVYLTPSEAEIPTGEERSLTLKVMRPEAGTELAVPIVVESKSEALNIPESVTFSADATEADLVVTYSEVGDGLNATLRIGDGYANTYAEQSGTTYFNLSIAVLEKLGDITFDSSSIFAQETNTLYNIKGQNEFVWENFLGSSVNTTFTVDTDASGATTFIASDLKKLKGGLSFYGNNWYDYYKSGGPYLMDNDGNYASWTPAGQTTQIDYFYVWIGSYSWIDFSEEPNAGYSGYLNSGLGYIYFYINY